LAKAILRNDVSVKSNKIPGQRETITLNDWCMMRKYNWVIKNELKYQFKGKPLPSKKKGFLNYTDKEWEQLAVEKNFTNAVMYPLSFIRSQILEVKS
jgi:hypothetical protein